MTTAEQTATTDEIMIVNGIQLARLDLDDDMIDKDKAKKATSPLAFAYLNGMDRVVSKD